VPRNRIREFLRGLHGALKPGAKVVFLDNRFVEGSSTPISERDDEGNTYQLRRLADGSSHRVLKNFPSQLELSRSLEGIGAEPRFHEWQYFWAVEYAVAMPCQ
jgi:demethylmenaquinone methyltransferase/2-methoxy-6-polyprenyl-1,4-benzoquinol methylase